MLQILSRSGLTYLTQSYLAKIIEAAVSGTPHRDRSLIIIRVEMFEREFDRSLVGRAESEPLFLGGLAGIWVLVDI